MEESGCDGVCEVEAQVIGCEKVWGVAQSCAAVEDRLRRKVLRYGLRGLLAA